MSLRIEALTAFVRTTDRGTGDAAASLEAAAFRNAIADARGRLAMVAETGSARRNDTDPASEKRVAARAAYDALAKELHDYLQKSPAEHWREQVLKEMGLTEADIAAMPPEQRATVEAAIVERIREKLLAGSEEDRSGQGDESV